MIYITGIHALNLPCKLDTCGDWHTTAIQWEKPIKRNSEDSVFKNFGIEANRILPGRNKLYHIADHIRACLDLLELGDFSNAQGMRKDYICNENYNDIIFQKVSLLRASPFWLQIAQFMEKEYLMKWLNFQKELCL